jgi:hypothetical protein
MERNKIIESAIHGKDIELDTIRDFAVISDILHPAYNPYKWHKLQYERVMKHIQKGGKIKFFFIDSQLRFEGVN